MLTAAITIITGVFIFVIGQAILKFIYEPYLEQQRIMLDVIHSIYAYADAHAGKPDASDVDDAMKKRILEASYKFKSLAAQLVAANAFVKGYNIWRYFLFAPSHDEIWQVAAKLAVLSNILCGHEVAVQEKVRIEILKKLGVSSQYPLPGII